VLAKVFNYYL